MKKNKIQKNYINEKVDIVTSLHPVVKLLMIILFIVITFVSNSLFLNLILIILIIGLALVSKLPKKTFGFIFFSAFVMLVFVGLINWLTIKAPTISIFDLDRTKFAFLNASQFKLGNFQDSHTGVFVIGGYGQNYVSPLIEPPTDDFTFCEMNGVSFAVIQNQDSYQSAMDTAATYYDFSNIQVSLVPYFDKNYIFVAYTVEWWAFSWKILFFSLNVTCKIFIVVMAVSILMQTTSDVQLAYAFTILFYPLSIFRAPVNEWGMTISLAIRFAPSLVQESQKILNAQASRGADFKNGKLKDKAKVLISLIVPMFTIAFIKSNDLANAMIVKNYNPRYAKTLYRKYSVKLRDILVLSIISFFIGVVISFVALHLFLSFFAYSDLSLMYGT
ncbi:MAG: energy-coupling factor transporter transmembrane protein EcfT [Mycoplasmataceae bacterium]|nr:energy-coupling factor transporter transmembrane protein EcfT [Mycoplasmataceae bacterium]